VPGDVEPSGVRAVDGVEGAKDVGKGGKGVVPMDLGGDGLDVGVLGLEEDLYRHGTTRCQQSRSTGKGEGGKGEGGKGGGDNLKDGISIARPESRAGA
jgi:hypothetical protein